MKFVYMVQCEGTLPATFHPLLGREDARLVHLTYREPVEGAIFLPGSTWTEGRNALLAEARSLDYSPDYYIFSDDDVLFLEGGWSELETELDRWRPPIATPKLAGYHGQTEPFPVCSVYAFDAMVNAFHRDVVDDEIVLPYVARFDHVTWWLSQLLVIHLAGVLYPDLVLKFTSCVIGNGLSRAYPRNVGVFEAASEWFKAAALTRPEDAAKVRVDFVNGATETPKRPSQPRPTWRLGDAGRSRLHRDWSSRPAGFATSDPPG